MHRTSLLAILALTAVTACKNDIQVAETPNQAPGVSINAPTDGAAVNAGQNIEFVGVVADQNGIEDIAVVSWTSSIDGELGSVETASPDPDGVTRVTSVLSPGVHAITLTATDVAGESGEETISVSVGTLDQDPSSPSVARRSSRSSSSERPSI